MCNQASQRGNESLHHVQSLRRRPDIITFFSMLTLTVLAHWVPITQSHQMKRGHCAAVAFNYKNKTQCIITDKNPPVLLNHPGIM